MGGSHEDMLVRTGEITILAFQELEGRPSDEEESSSSEDEREWRAELKRQRKEAKINEQKHVPTKPKFYELKSGENFRSMKSTKTASALKDKKYVSVYAESKTVEGRVMIDFQPQITSNRNDNRG